MSMILKNTVLNLKLMYWSLFKLLWRCYWLVICIILYNRFAKCIYWAFIFLNGLQLHGTYGHVKLLCFGKVSVLYLELDWFFIWRLVWHESTLSFCSSIIWLPGIILGCNGIFCQYKFWKETMIVAQS
jgi:hypothetical protein